MFFKIDRHPTYRPNGTAGQRIMLAIKGNNFLDDIKGDLRRTAASMLVFNPVSSLESFAPKRNGIWMESEIQADGGYAVMVV